MKLDPISGDIVNLAKNGNYDVIIHCQNCFHGWKKGIVTSISKAFPSARKADLNTAYGDKNKLGTYSYGIETLESGKILIIANLYAQFSFGQGNHLKEKKLEECLIALNKEFSGKKIGYPLIGAGRAGGDWKLISKIIDESLTDCDHQLVKYTQ